MKCMNVSITEQVHSLFCNCQSAFNMGKAHEYI